MRFGPHAAAPSSWPANSAFFAVSYHRKRCERPTSPIGPKRRAVRIRSGQDGRELSGAGSSPSVVTRLGARPCCLGSEVAHETQFAAGAVVVVERALLSRSSWVITNCGLKPYRVKSRLWSERLRVQVRSSREEPSSGVNGGSVPCRSSGSAHCRQR